MPVPEEQSISLGCGVSKHPEAMDMGQGINASAVLFIRSTSSGPFPSPEVTLPRPAWDASPFNKTCS